MRLACKNVFLFFITSLVFSVLILLRCDFVLSEGYRIDSGKKAVLNQSMHVRSGPGSAYSGIGTYFESGTEICVLTSARDSSGNCWIQVEFRSNGVLKRGYAPANCLSIDPNSLPSESSIGQYTVSQESNGRFGPGTEYGSQKLIVPSGAVIIVFAVENGYAQIEYTENGSLVRTWIPRSQL